MKKGKKVLAVTLTAAMALSCLTACGGKSGKGGATEAPARKTGATVKVDDSKLSGLADLGIEAPEAVDNAADAEKIELTVWCPAEEQDVMKKLCEEFDASRPEYDITFNYEYISESEAGNMLMNDPNKSADVFMYSGDQMSSLVDNKLLYDISVLTKEEKDLADKYDSQAYNACVVDGALYALPFTANQFFLYYNKSMYTEDEVKNLDTMMAKDLGEAKNFSMELNNGWYILSFFYANGCTLYGDGTEATKCDWNNADAISVVKYLNNMVATGKFHNSKDDDAISEMKDGKLGSFITGSWNSNAIKEALGDNYAAAACPAITIDGKDKNMTPFADYKEIGVNAVTKFPQASAYLAYFLCDDYAQYVRLQLRSYAPTIKKLQEAVLVDEEVNPAVSAATIQMDADHSVLRPTTSQLKVYWSYGATLGSLIYNQDERITDESKVQGTLDTIVKGITSSLTQ